LSKEPIKSKETKPKNANGEGSVFQIKSGKDKGKWIAQVAIGFYPLKKGQSKKRPKYKKVLCKSQPEAKRERKKMLKELENGIDLQGQANLTVGSWITTWMLLYRKNDIELTTWENDDRQINTHIIPELGHILLKDLTTDDIQGFYNKMMEDGSAAATVRKNHQILSMCLSQADENGKICRNPAKASKPPKLEDEDARAMTEEEMAIFLDGLTKIKGPFKTRGVWPVIFLTLLGTGLREGEVLSLRWSTVNLRKRTAKVLETLVRTKEKGLIFTDPKTKKSKREVPLPDEAAFAIRLHRINQAKFRLASGEKYQNQNLVFCTSKGTPIEPRGLIRAFHRIRDKAGLPKDLTVHSLRHTFATRLLEEGVSLKVVADLLGHEDISTTGNTYSHVHPKMKTAAANEINSLLKRKKASPKERMQQAKILL